MAWLSAPSETTTSALARDRALALGDEQHEQIEVLRDEWHRTSVLEEHTVPRREDERAEREAHEENANRRLRRLVDSRQ